MKDDFVAKMRAKQLEIPAGREGRWFDPGEYEDLKQAWFDDYSEGLLQLAEAFNEKKAERLRAIAFHVTMLVEALQERKAITPANVQASLSMVEELKAMANDILPEPPVGEQTVSIYKEHLQRLQQLRNQYGNVDEGRFLDSEIADVQKRLDKLAGPLRTDKS